MKVISLTNELGLTKGKVYTVIEESSGFCKVELDNRNIAYRSTKYFDIVANKEAEK